jgi:hypothetical protein
MFDPLHNKSQPDLKDRIKHDDHNQVFYTESNQWKNY